MILSFAICALETIVIIVIDHYLLDQDYPNLKFGLIVVYKMGVAGAFALLFSSNFLFPSTMAS